MEKFQKDITFIKKQPFTGEDGNSITWKAVETTKTASFKELDQTDKEQHKLHFKIISLGESVNGSDSESLTVNSDTLYDITVKSINTLLVIDQNFTAEDKADFLSDSAAILRFGLFMLQEKFTPFFSKFKIA